jgi:hypothetical protein
MQKALTTAFDAGNLNRIEFYGRKREWNARWTNNFRTLYHATIYRHSLIRKVEALLR